jgi:DNA-directed RNA polymerase I and III subunit RPAC1
LLLDEDVAVVADPRKDLCSRNVLRFDDLKGSVVLSKKKDHFIFNVESTGAMESHELVVEACRVIQDKSTNLMNLFLEELRKISPEKV